MATAARVIQIKPIVVMPGWHTGPRIAFRFCFLYLGLFCLTTQIFASLFPIPKLEMPDLSSFWPIQPIVFWTAANVFGAKLPLVYEGSGSGDKTFDWVLAFCLLIFSICATALWTFLDRKRSNYASLEKWFRLFIRFALAAQMLSYGMAKAIPLQMPFPHLDRLLEPFGNFSPMGALWSSIGASQGYEIFAGCVEILAGLLLIFPRTTTLGALLGLLEMIEVFTLNMTYDVPVKLFSFHLILLNLFLLAPELPRLTDFFIRNRATFPFSELQLFDRFHSNRKALFAQIGFGAWLLAMNAYGSSELWYESGGGREPSPLYGIWNVSQMYIDGHLRPLLLTDKDLWRHAIFDLPQRMTVERMDGELSRFNVSIKTDAKTLELSRANDGRAESHFTFQQPGPDRLTLAGAMEGHKVRMQLQLVDLNNFPLVSRGFHWVQEYPFNR